MACPYRQAVLTLIQAFKVLVNTCETFNTKFEFPEYIIGISKQHYFFKNLSYGTSCYRNGSSMIKMIKMFN